MCTRNFSKKQYNVHTFNDTATRIKTWTQEVDRKPNYCFPVVVSDINYCVFWLAGDALGIRTWSVWCIKTWVGYNIIIIRENVSGWFFVSSIGNNALCSTRVVFSQYSCEPIKMFDSFIRQIVMCVFANRLYWNNVVRNAQCETIFPTTINNDMYTGSLHVQLFDDKNVTKFKSINLFSLNNN